MLRSKFRQIRPLLNPARLVVFSIDVCQRAAGECSSALFSGFAEKVTSWGQEVEVEVANNGVLSEDKRTLLGTAEAHQIPQI